MIRYEYLSETVDLTELQMILNNYGDQGWRLHTCEVYGANALIVMDRAFTDAVEEDDDYMSDSSGAMAMKS